MGTKDIIKQKRIELGLTMKELANKVGVSEATISRWESGNIATMKQTKIALLAQVLGISPAVLVSGEIPDTTDIKLTPRDERQIAADLEKCLLTLIIRMQWLLWAARSKMTKTGNCCVPACLLQCALLKRLQRKNTHLKSIAKTRIKLWK